MKPNAKKFACSACDKVYLSRSALNQHIKKAHNANQNEKPFACSYCHKRFWVNNDLMSHTRTHTGERPLPCSPCKLRFARKGNLDRHVRTLHQVHGPPSNPCPAPGCRKLFSNTWGLKRHLATHDKLRPTYPCPSCDKLYHSKQRLEGHEKFSHRGRLKEHVCTYCDKRFPSFSRLVVHLRSHTDEKPYACAICPRAFRQRGGLRVHETSFHKDARHNDCKQSDKQFKSASALLKHEDSHKNVAERRSFECEECGKKLTTKSGLKLHKTIHMDREEYQHSCPVCDKKLAKAADLRLHVVTHTGEKPHVCNECGKAFGVRPHLRRHQRTVHNKANPSSN